MTDFQLFLKGLMPSIRSMTREEGFLGPHEAWGVSGPRPEDSDATHYDAFFELKANGDIAVNIDGDYARPWVYDYKDGKGILGDIEDEEDALQEFVLPIDDPLLIRVLKRLERQFAAEARRLSVGAVLRRLPKGYHVTECGCAEYRITMRRRITYVRERRSIVTISVGQDRDSYPIKEFKTFSPERLIDEVNRLRQARLARRASNAAKRKATSASM